MFARWGRFVVRARWAVIVAGAVLAVVGAVWGAGVFNTLSNGGFGDPHSESAKAEAQINNTRLGDNSPDVIALYSSPTATVDDPAFRGPLTAALDRISHRPEVASLTSYYSAGAQGQGLVSHDRHSTFVAIKLAAPGESGGNAKLDVYKTLRPALNVAGLDTGVGGATGLQSEANDLTKQDIARGESIAMPLVLLLLVIIFRGVVAAAMPMLVGVLAILGALTTTRILTEFTTVSTFAANTITLLGLGMGIDYALFTVSRFREQIRAGDDVETAIVKTMSTAGRTIVFSGVTIALALASLLIFPEVFLRSMGMGGVAAVLIAALASTTVLPALLAVLGPKIDAWRIPVPRAGRRAAARPAREGAWTRIAHTVMRRPIRFIGAVLAIIVLLGLPFRNVHFGGFDHRVLPTGSQPRVVAEKLATDFSTGTAAPIEVVLGKVDAAAVSGYTANIKALPNVTDVTTTDPGGPTSLLSVDYRGEPTADSTYTLVRAIRALPAPPGATVQVGGAPADDVDLLKSLGSLLPWMALLMATVTMVLLFLAFGSVGLSVQAVAMNVVSLAAAAGAMVWVFQQGHLSGVLGFTATGTIQPNVPILILATLFGLSTDYEVFLLSRIREEWDAGKDNTTAVAAGLQRTGGIITAAAALLIVVTAGFASGQVIFAKIIGIGMMVAILVDATLVRALLVPAVMRLAGRANWWAPGPLARVYRRYGMRESEPDIAPPVPRPVRRSSVET